MKIGFLILISLISLNVFSATPINIDCVTETPSTSYIVRTQGDQVVLTIYHHNGVDYAPIHKGVITSADLDILKKRGEIVKKIGKFLKIEWPLKQCSQPDLQESIFSCMGDGRITAPEDVHGEAFAVYSTLSQEKSFAGKFDYIDMAVDVTIGGENLYLPMRFNSYECLNSGEQKSVSRKLKK